MKLNLRNLNCQIIYSRLSLKKPITDSAESKLAKVLNKFDLTALGIGSTLGLGVYVLAGQVSKIYAGPAVIFSFMFAAIASIFAGLCFAEFGARVPKAGSVYIYSYVTIGEFIAFVIGWDLILEYGIGSASVVKGLSTYFDSILDNAMQNFFKEHLPMNVAWLSEYPDFFAFSATMTFSFAIAFGAKESTILNSVFTMLNLSVVLLVVIAGLFKVDASNWAIPKEEVTPGHGSGGFMPYGIPGVIRGAAVCFYGFIGFDCIATAGEEAKNPKKSIPFAIIVSLTVIFLAYFCISTVLTMMLPYFEQDENAPLIYVFKIFGWTIIRYFVSIGAIFGISSSLMGAMFPLPRVIYAMASDGLIFKFMGKINERFKTPFIGTIIAGLIVGTLAAIFNLSQLVNMMSIGTLLGYSMVASCVLILRYESDEKNNQELPNEGNKTNNPELLNEGKQTNFSTVFKKIITKSSGSSNNLSSNIVKLTVTFYSIWCILFGIIANKIVDDNENVYFLHYILFGLSIIPIILSLYIISVQPVSSSELYFKVPLVPWLPGISILINIYLMLQLDSPTWIRFVIWMCLGLIVYFTYGIRNSNQQKNKENEEIVELGK